MIEPHKISRLNAQWQQDAQSGDSVTERAAQEICDGCHSALIVLGKNLERLSYPCPTPCPTILQSCTESLESRVTVIENKIQARIPPILKTVWARVGDISLVDFRKYSHADYWEDKRILGRDGYGDALCIEGCTEEWTEFVCSDFDDWVDSYDAIEKIESPFMLSLSPDCYHKDNVSGGSSYGVYPSDSWLPVWENFTWIGLRKPESGQFNKVDLLSYLRTAVLECAGFPGFYGDSKFEPIRRELLSGIQVF